MATGVKPRDEENHLTRSDLEAIQDAMKSKKFREMLSEYCEEVRDPANQAIYQKEMTQLEKERGYDVTFINPKGSYVIKTSVAGDRKAFINICSNDNVGKPSYNIQEAEGKRGMNWQIPYSIIPPREDYDHKRQRCVIYDVVFHPDTVRMAEVNKRFRELVNKTAVDGLQETYNIHLDSNNFRYPKSHYKGMTIPAVIRKEDPNFKPPEEDCNEELSAEALDKLYPQRLYPEKSAKQDDSQSDATQRNRAKKPSNEFTHSSENGYTIPKYVIKQQKNIEFEDFTYHKDSKQYSAIPSQIVVEINLPLLSSTKDCVLDVQERSLSLLSEKPAKYKLNISLPYSVNEECGNAKFDKSKRKLIVTLPVIKKNMHNGNKNYLRVDSGVESEENSSSQSDEENNNKSLIVEVSSSNNDTTLKPKDTSEPPLSSDDFLEPTLGYILPQYTYNAMDDIIAFTFHVKNTDPESVKVKKFDNKVYIKFTTIGTSFVPIHYAAVITFDESIKFNDVNGEAWDNNVILQLELNGEAPHKFQIGVDGNSMTTEYVDITQNKKVSKPLEENHKVEENEAVSPVVEVTNLGSETNIVVSSSHLDYDEDDIEDSKDKQIRWVENNCDTEAKSILRKPMSMMRSYSESSVGDVASSMDYISSDCIPEESSLKKTVRFSDVIARQFYRYNSSIEGQKKKNQRKKSKKRNLERRRSESEAEDDARSPSQPSQTRLKSALKQRRDSGLADTSDAEAEFKSGSFNTANDYEPVTTNTNDTPKSMLDIVNNDTVKVEAKADIWETEGKPKKEPRPDSVTCENIRHHTNLYDPDKLNKGQYLEVSFKNDLIFDLDM